MAAYEAHRVSADYCWTSSTDIGRIAQYPSELLGFGRSDAHEAGHPMLVAGEIDTNSQEEAQDQAGEQRTLEHKDNWVGFKSSFMFHEG